MKASRKHGALCYFACLGLVYAGCNSQVSTRDNAYDPQGTNPAPAQLEVSFLLPGGDPAAGAAGVTVRLEEGSDPVAPALSDAEGKASFGGLSPGRYRLLANLQGYVPYERSVTLAPAQTLTLPAYTLTPVGGSFVSITGNVVVEGAAYAGGVLVRAVASPYNTVSAADGSFNLGLPKGLYDLELSVRDHEAATLSQVVAPTDVGEVVLAVKPNTLTITISRELCGEGQLGDVKAEGAQVVLQDQGGAPVASATTDLSGNATLLGVPGGRFTLVASFTGYHSETLAVEVHDGQVRSLPPLRLVSQRGSLRGRVHLEGSSNDGGVTVSLSGRVRTGVSGADGRYRLSEVCGGVYELTASTTKPGYLPVVEPRVTISEGVETVVRDLTLRVGTGGLSLNGGAPYTNTLSLSYDLVAPPLSTEMRISEELALFQDPARSAEGWIPLLLTGSFSLSVGEGEKTVYAQTRTAAGTPSPMSQALVVLDQTDPSLDKLVVESGSGFSNAASGAPLLQIQGSDTPPVGTTRFSGIAWVRIFDRDLDPALCPGGAGSCPPIATEWQATAIEPYRLYLAHTVLRPLVDENKELWVRVGDAAGNWSVASPQDVILDRVAPAGMTISLAGSTPGYARSSTVVVTPTATDLNPIQMRLFNDSSFSGAIWRPFVGELSWPLNSGDGLRELWIQFRDAAGNTAAPLSASITVDTQAPAASAFSVVGGDYAASATLGLQISQTGASELRIDQDGALGAWQMLPTGPLSFPVSLGSQTTKRVNLSLNLRDAAGNDLGAARPTLFVTVDLDPPADPAPLILEGALTSSSNATLLTRASGGPLDADQMRLTLNGAAQGWTPYALQQTVSLVEGNNTLGVELRDRAGNQNSGGVQNVSVTLDTLAPQLSSVAVMSSAGDSSWTRSRSVQLAVTASDAGNLEMRASTDASFAGAAWATYVPNFGMALADRDGAQTVYLELRDGVGHRVSGQDSITLDRVAPQTLSLVAPAYVNTASLTGGVSVELFEAGSIGAQIQGVAAVYLEGATQHLDCAQSAAAAAASPAVQVAVSIPTSSCVSQPCTLPISTLVLPSENRYRLEVCFHDAAGNAELQSTRAPLVFDQSPPVASSAPILVPDGRQLIASWAALGDPGPAAALDYYELQVATEAAFGSPTLVSPIAPDRQDYVVTGLTNWQRYYVRLRGVDLAGNALPWSAANAPAAQVLVGTRAVKLPLAAGFAASNPASTQVGSEVWIVNGDSELGVPPNIPTPILSFRVRRCDLAKGSCASPAAWEEVLLLQDNPPSPVIKNAALTRDIKMIATASKLWFLAEVENPPGSSGASLDQLIVAGRCDLNTNCLLVGSWQVVLLADAPFSSTKLNPQVSLGETGGVILAAWSEEHPAGLFPGLRSCPESKGCMNAGDWNSWYSPVDTAVASNAAAGPLAIVARGQDLALVYEAIAPSGATSVNAWGCSPMTGCLGSQWTAGLGVIAANKSLESVILDKGRVYALLSDGSPTRSLESCNLGIASTDPGCSAGWLSLTISAPGLASGASMQLGATSTALHAVWWDGGSQSVRYWTCPDTFSIGCTGAGARSTVLEQGVILDQPPFVAGSEDNLIVMGKSDQGSLRLMLPAVPIPAHSAAALGDGSVGVSWTPVGGVAGYDLLGSSSTAFPTNWSQVIPIFDPLASSATRSISGSGLSMVGVRARATSGGLSDDAPVVRTQPLRLSLDLASSIKEQDSAGDLEQLTVASIKTLPGSETLALRLCDFGGTQCALSSDWATVTLASVTSPDKIESVDVELVGDELWVAAIVSGKFIHAWSCSLVAGPCTSKAEFLDHLIATVASSSLRLALHDDGADSVDRVALTYDDGSGGQYTICDDSLVPTTGNCVDGLGSFPINPVDGASIRLGALGSHAIAVGPGGVALVRVPDNPIAPVLEPTYYWCPNSLGIVKPCSSHGLNRPGSWIKQGVQVLLRQDSTPVILGLHDGQIDAYLCDYGASVCGESSAFDRWTKIRIGSFFYQQGYRFSVRASGRSLYMVYQLDGRSYYGACRERCDRARSWRFSLVRNVAGATPGLGGGAGWLDTSANPPLFGLAVPVNQGGGSPSLQTFVGAEIDPYF